MNWMPHYQNIIKDQKMNAKRKIRTEVPVTVKMYMVMCVIVQVLKLISNILNNASTQTST